MKLPDKVYDVLKWVGLVVIPAVATFYNAMCAIWGWPFGDEVVSTATAVCTLIGALIGISTAEYRKTL